MVVEPGAETSLSEEKVGDYLFQKLANYKRLEGGMKFVARISKTPNGKILKRVLREEAKTETSSQTVRKLHSKQVKKMFFHVLGSKDRIKTEYRLWANQIEHFVQLLPVSMRPSALNRKK